MNQASPPASEPDLGIYRLMLLLVCFPLTFVVLVVLGERIASWQMNLFGGSHGIVVLLLSFGVSFLVVVVIYGLTRGWFTRRFLRRDPDQPMMRPRTFALVLAASVFGVTVLSAALSGPHWVHGFAEPCEAHASHIEARGLSSCLGEVTLHDVTLAPEDAVSRGIKSSSSYREYYVPLVGLARSAEVEVIVCMDEAQFDNATAHTTVRGTLRNALWETPGAVIAFLRQSGVSVGPDPVVLDLRRSASSERSSAMFYTLGGFVVSLMMALLLYLAVRKKLR